MALENYKRNHGTPPPVYSESAPGGMENEMYVDGTLYVDGVAVTHADQKRRSGRQKQRQENPCAVALRFIRSKLFICNR